MPELPALRTAGAGRKTGGPAWITIVSAAALMVLVVVMAMLAPVVAHAKEAAPLAEDPALEARMTRITAELRCLVCQNQTIADSNADLAVDLRRQVRQMLTEGKSQQQILDYMTARYGDFVLYRPPLKESTALLWFGPVLLLVGGLVVLALVLRRRSLLPADRFEVDELDASDALDAMSQNHPAQR